MISIKRDVKLHTLSPQIVLALLVAWSIYRNRGYRIMITSGNEGQHMAGSKHYTGDALDLRTNDLPDQMIEEITHDIRDALGPDYDVIAEPTHLHIEYDPKRAPDVREA